MKYSVSKSTGYQLPSFDPFLVPWLKPASTNLHVLFAADLAGKPWHDEYPVFEIKNMEVHRSLSAIYVSSAGHGL